MTKSYSCKSLRCIQAASLTPSIKPHTRYLGIIQMRELPAQVM